ncbi:MAG TPA: ATP-binding protein [Herpetosiphonaceae bacterium]
MDEAKSKEQLIDEVRSLRQRLAEVEALQNQQDQIEKIFNSQTTILDAVDEAVIVTQLDGQIVYWNLCAQELYGWSAAEVLGRNIVDVTPSTMSRAQAIEVMERLRSGEKWSGEFEVQRRDGLAFPALVTNAPIRDAQNNLIGIIGFSEDLTKHKELQAKLREETETVETINRIGQLLSAELDLQRLVQTVTDAATDLTGAEFGAFFYNVIDERGESYTLYTLSGVSSDRFANFPMPRNTDIFGPTFRGEAVIRLENVQLDPRYGQNAPYTGMPPGHLPVVSYLAVPVSLRSGEILGGLFFGHSQPGVFTARAERIAVGLAAQTAIAMDNARLYQQAQQAIRTRDEFLSLAAHELKTPITSILGYVQVLQRRVQQESLASERNERALRTIAQQAKRLNQLIISLFDLSRLQIGQLAIERAAVDLRELVQRIVDEMQPTIERHSLIFRADHFEHAPIVLGDPLRLEQVVQNLLHNAVKYSPDGGVIDVRVTRDGADGQHPRHVCIEIADGGIGIPAESLPYVFRRFFRAKNVEQTQISGVGVGLYVAKEIVTLHGGTINVESTEGVGSTFHVCLPLKDTSERGSTITA